MGFCTEGGEEKKYNNNNKITILLLLLHLVQISLLNLLVADVVDVDDFLGF